MSLVGTCQPTGLPAWSRIGAIGDYGGASDKLASEREGETPYAYFVYRELQSQRGSAYTKKAGTLVHVENLALARLLAYVNFRHPEKARANATPLKSDDMLEYWAEVLKIPTRPSEQRWEIRERAVAHYQAALGPTFSSVQAACQRLLGDAFVQLIIVTGDDIDHPPAGTYWPGVNPGAPGDDLGGGTWSSSRCRLIVEVTQPPGMSDEAFLQLTRVQLFQLLDRLLPAWATFIAPVLDSGFRVGISRLGLQGLGEPLVELGGDGDGDGFIDTDGSGFITVDGGGFIEV